MTLYTYKCVIERIIDGDTIDCSIDLGFDMWMHRARVRLDGIDTPEIRTTDDTEKWLGNLAKNFVEELLPVGTKTIFFSKKYNPSDIYNRLTGDFRVPNHVKPLTEILIDGRYAAKYYPKYPELTLQEHLDNRDYWLNQGNK